MEHHLRHKDVRKLIKKNEFQEMVAAAVSGAKKNSENLIIGAIILIIIAVAVPLFLNSQAKKEEKAQGLLAQANYYYNLPVGEDKNTGVKYFASEAEKYERIIGAYSEILQNYKGTKASSYAYLGTADAYYAAGKYMESMEYYNTFITKNPRHEMTDDAISGRAYCNYRLNNYREAAADWEDVIKKYPGANTYFDAKIHAAMSYEKMGEKEKAGVYYAEIIKENPDSAWARDAKAKLPILD
jgi:tetratricopeptide (TPR) repeat protein